MILPNQEALLKNVELANGYSIITTRFNVPFQKSLLKDSTSSVMGQLLKIIRQVGSSVLYIDLDVATKLGISVTCAAGALTQ